MDNPDKEEDPDKETPKHEELVLPKNSIEKLYVFDPSHRATEKPEGDVITRRVGKDGVEEVVHICGLPRPFLKKYSLQGSRETALVYNGSGHDFCVAPIIRQLRTHYSNQDYGMVVTAATAYLQRGTCGKALRAAVIFITGLSLLKLREYHEAERVLKDCKDMISTLSLKRNIDLSEFGIVDSVDLSILQGDIALCLNYLGIIKVETGHHVEVVELYLEAAEKNSHGILAGLFHLPSPTVASLIDQAALAAIGQAVSHGEDTWSTLTELLWQFKQVVLSPDGSNSVIDNALLHDTDFAELVRDLPLRCDNDPDHLKFILTQLFCSFPFRVISFYSNFGNIMLLLKNYKEAVLFYTRALACDSTDNHLSLALRALCSCAYFEPSSHLACRAFTLCNLACRYWSEVLLRCQQDFLDVVTSGRLGLSLACFENYFSICHMFYDSCVRSRTLLASEQYRERPLGEIMQRRYAPELPFRMASTRNFDQIKAAVSTSDCPVCVLMVSGIDLLGCIFDNASGEVKMSPFRFDWTLPGEPLREASVLDENCFDLYKSVSCYNEITSGPGQQLFSLVARNLLTILMRLRPGNSCKIVIIEDNNTARLSLPGIFDPGTESFLGDHYAFQHFPSLCVMSIMNQLPKTCVNINLPLQSPYHAFIAGISIAPSQFQCGNYQWSLDPLPNARKEAEHVAHLFKATPLIDSLVSKLAACEIMKTSELIHLVVHIIQEGSSLVFHVDGPLGSNSLLLTAKMVERDVKTHAALVVLPCSRSSFGKATDETFSLSHEIAVCDMMMDLTRSFLVAGAQSVLNSIWSVPDESSFIFLKFFYQFMMDGLDSIEALHKAIISIRCFPEFSHPIHSSGYRIFGRSVRIHNDSSMATSLLDMHMGPASSFPRLVNLNALFKGICTHCYPTNVQVIPYFPGGYGEETVIDFIHHYHDFFTGGMYWIHCHSEHTIAASIKCIEKHMGMTQEQGLSSVLQQKHILVVLDSLKEVPRSEPLRRMIRKMYTHTVILCHHPSVCDLVNSIEEELGLACNFHSFEILGLKNSLQRIVYSIQKNFDFFALPKEQAALEWIANFTHSSLVCVDIASQILQECLADASMRSSCPQAQQIAMREAVVLLRDKLAQSSTCSVDEEAASPSISSVNVCTELIYHIGLSRDQILLLNGLSVFGYMPIPVSVVTELSILTAKVSVVGISYGSLLPDLLKKGCVKVYPLPSIQPSPLSYEPELVCVPQEVAHSLWDTMTADDRIAVLSSCHASLCNITPERSNCQFILALALLLLETIERCEHQLNFGYTNAQAITFRYLRVACCSRVCELNDLLAHFAK